MRSVAGVVVLALAVFGAGSPATAATAAAAARHDVAVPVALAAQINAADFARFDRTLSSDAFAGRKPATPAEQQMHRN